MVNQIETKTLLNDLQILGLTQLEGKVMIALIKLGIADASKLVSSSGVPQSKIYKILSQLENRQLIQSEQLGGRRRNIYRRNNTS